jgi:hypothetical protein
MHSNYLAPCAVRGVGSYPTASDIGVQNDSTSAIMLGANVQVVLCRDTNYLLDCQKFTGNISNLGDSRIDHDRASSAKVQLLGTQECEPGTMEVGFFMHRDLVAPCSVKGIGEYRNAAALAVDDISSIKVGASVQACICLDSGFGGECATVSDDQNNLRDAFPGYHDDIGSAKVQQRGAECRAVAPPAAGYGKIVVSNCANVTIYLWTRAEGAFWTAYGSLPPRTQSQACGSSTREISLMDSQVYEFAAVDPTLGPCPGNDPVYGGCQRDWRAGIRGKMNGPVLYISVY